MSSAQIRSPRVSSVPSGNMSAAPGSVPPSRPRGTISIAEIAAFYPALAGMVSATTSALDVDPFEAEFLDGPELVRWLRSEGLETSRLGVRNERRVVRWVGGANPHYLDVDELLPPLGLHLHDIPPGVWIPRPPNVSMPDPTPDLRARAVDRVRDGEPVVAVADDLAISTRSVRMWCQAAGVKTPGVPGGRFQRRDRFGLVPCQACGGEGWRRSGARITPCRRCHGTGRIPSGD